VKDARSLSLSWHLCSPLQGGSYCAGRSLPDWLKEVRSLRGSVLFDNGRRRNFRTEEGRLFDADPIDPYAYHILAYDAMRLVGCVRVYPLISNGFSCVTEQILGEKTFSELLYRLGAQRTETVEIGRFQATDRALMLRHRFGGPGDQGGRGAWNLMTPLHTNTGRTPIALDCASRVPSGWSSRCAIGGGFCSARNNASERFSFPARHCSVLSRYRRRPGFDACSYRTCRGSNNGTHKMR
jgi:hypothetical protein